MLADGDPEQEFEIMTYLQERPIPEALDYLREHYLAYTDDRVKATLVKNYRNTGICSRCTDCLYIPRR